MSAPSPGSPGASASAQATHVAQLKAAMPLKKAADLDRLIRLDEVKALTGLGRASIYAGMAARTFPASVHIGARSVAWRLSSIVAWCDNPVPAPSRSATQNKGALPVAEVR